MQKFFNLILDIIFPPKPEELKLRAISPVDFLQSVRQASPVPLPFVSSLFAYKDPLVTELIWQIKYKKNRHAIEIAGYSLYQALAKKYSGSVTLIPIPISKKRRRERGYNQCELLVDEIIRLDADKIFKKDYNLLIRSKHIERQTLKGREERIENSKNIFEVVKNEEFNQKIILIDDVTTTGSTLKEAIETLADAGYTEIEALTVAH